MAVGMRPAHPVSGQRPRACTVMYMDIAAVLQGAILVLIVGLLVWVGALVQRLRRLSAEARGGRETRFERQVRRRLRREGFSDAEATAALEDSASE
jgi:hypothetical protein